MGFCNFFMFFICVFALKNMKIKPKNSLCTGRIYPTFDRENPQHPIEDLREICGVMYDGQEMYKVYALKSQRQVCDMNIFTVFVDGNPDPKHPNPFINELCEVVYNLYDNTYTMHPRPL